MTLQDPALTHLLLGALSGIVIAAAAYRARGVAFLALLLAAAWIVYVITDAGIPELERRVTYAVAYVRAHGDFFRGLMVGNSIFSLIAAGFYAGKRSRRA